MLQISGSTRRLSLLPFLFLLIFIATGGTLFAGCDENEHRKDVGDTAAGTSGTTSTDGDGGSAATTDQSGTSAVSTNGSFTSSSVSTASTSSSGTTGTTSDNSSPTTQGRSTATVGPGDDEPAAYDPAVFDRLLKANVSNGRVDYGAFKRSDEFARFLESLKTADPSTMATNEQLAFWINAYNALVIKNVNDNPGIKKPLDVAGFFDKKTFTAAGRTVTLNDIENTIIRPTFKEPLIHFGLVCAALSCPPLIPKAYTSANVREQLAENARSYLADTKQNRWDAKTKTLSLSKIFEWYKVDFGDNDAGLIAFAKQYGPEAMRSGLEGAGSPKVAFVEYDWTLNAK